MARPGRRGFLVAVVTALALLAIPLPALATFAVNIQGPGPYGGAGITVFDGGVGDLAPTAGVILISAGSAGLPVIPGFAFSIDTSISNSPGGPSFSLLDLNWTLGSVGTLGGTITVTASADGFTFPASGVGSSLTSAVAGTLTPGAGNSVTAQQWVDLSNLLFGLGAVTAGPQGPFGPLAFGSTATTAFSSLTPYSITDRLILTLGAGALTTGNLQSTVVPEPATVFLGGLGLIVLGYAARRRLLGR